MATLHDIANRADIENLVNTFYDKVNADPLLSPIFNEVAKVDWPEHLPQMYRFWESLLLGSGTFQGRPFPKHAVLPVIQEHFERWLTLFGQTVNELFDGPKALEAKLRALTIADTFAMRMGVLQTPENLRQAVFPETEALPPSIRYHRG